MASSSVRRFVWPQRLALAGAAGLGVMALSQAVRSGSDQPVNTPFLLPREPISTVDARLHAEGWSARPDRDPLPDERRLAGNNLASLSACSGTGLGLCRYDYEQGQQRVAVVTVPGDRGDGVVHSWFNPD